MRELQAARLRLGLCTNVLAALGLDTLFGSVAGDVIARRKLETEHVLQVLGGLDVGARDRDPLRAGQLRLHGRIRGRARRRSRDRSVRPAPHALASLGCPR